jgi:hypothetical protein
MITIDNNPASGSTVQDALWHVCSSDNSGSTDMKFVFDIWVNGAQKIRVKKVPEPSNGKAYFDAGPTVRNYMTYEWFEPLTVAYVAQPNDSGEISIAYQLRVGEEVSGTTTTNLASGTTTAYNYTAPLFKRRQISLADKLNKWFTNRPAYANTDFGQNIYIPFYTNTTLTLKCSTYDWGNNLIATASGSPTAIAHGFVQMNIGSAAIAAALSITINDNVKYYDVWFNSFDKIRVYNKCNEKYTPISVHFVNRWGMWDSQMFGLVSKLTMETTRKDFTQRDYRFNSINVDYMSASNRYYESKTNYHQKSDWTYKLTADALNDDEWVWMADLLSSPQMLMEIDGNFYPVTLKTSNYEYSKYENNRLRPLELEFEMNQSRLSHLR